MRPPVPADGPRARWRRLIGREAPRTDSQRAERKRDARRAWIGIVIAVLAIVPTVYQIYADSGPDRPDEFVAQCRAAHGVPPVPVPRPSADGEWSGCSWPPVTGAAEDGFYRLTVESRRMPGAANADEFTTVQSVRSGCSDLLLQYRFDNQGTEEQQPPLRVANNQIISGYTGLGQNPYAAGAPDVVANGGLVVFTNDRYTLVRAECTTPP